MNARVREARPGDLTAVAHVLNESNPDQPATTPLELLARLAHSVLIVAEDNTGIVGTITIAGPGTPESTEAEEDGAFIYGAAVLPRVRHQGIFNQMARQAIKALRSRDFTSITFRALDEAKTTRRLALKLGAKEIPTRDDMAQLYILDIKTQGR